MNRILKIINKLKIVPLKVTEEQYYEQLFIKNDGWNKPTPNNDEFKRWTVIESFIKEIKNDDNLKILDLGCGRGWLTNLLSQFGQVIGIEPVDKVVEYAKSIFPEIQFLKGTAKKIVNQYKENFDLIVSSEVIEHIPDLEKQQFVKEIYMLLKKDGFLIITTPRKDVEIEWNKHSGSNQPIEDWISEYDLKSLFEENGFSAKRIERVSLQPKSESPFIDIYQVWLFKKKKDA